MAMVRVKGKPDFFLTFTCNSCCLEIKRSLFEDQQTNQRPDIIARVFHMKVDTLLTDFLKHDMLGHVRRRFCDGERNSDILLIAMVPRNKLRTSTDTDCVVSAEIPDKSATTCIVRSHLIHDPCGQWNPHSPCIVDQKCSKDYPKQLRHATSFSDDWPLYRRWAEVKPGSPISKTIRRGINVSVNNAWVVPYNPYILLRYNTDINLEIVCAVSSVKYLYKYLEKGPDQCLLRLDLWRTLTWGDMLWVRTLHHCIWGVLANIWFHCQTSYLLNFHWDPALPWLWISANLYSMLVFSAKDFCSYGQFCVATSRVGRSNSLCILALDEETKKKHHFLCNLVFTEALTQ